MAKKIKPHLFFGARLTAYEAPDHLDDLNAFIRDGEHNTLVCVDAGHVETIDTAGCQMIDLAITAARYKKARLELNLSDAVRNAFNCLGIPAEDDPEGQAP